MSNYAYAATRVMARRSRLLGPESYNQLLNMEFSEIARYIQDLEYRREIDKYGASLRGADLLETALLDNRSTEIGEVIGFCTGELRKSVEPMQNVITSVVSKFYCVESLTVYLQKSCYGKSRL